MTTVALLQLACDVSGLLYSTRVEEMRKSVRARRSKKIGLRTGPKGLDAHLVVFQGEESKQR